MQDYAMSAAGVRGRGPAGGAPGRSRRRPNASSRRRCGRAHPARSRMPLLAVRTRLQLAKVDWSTRRARRPPGTCCARSMTSCSSGRTWARWSSRSRSSRQMLRRAAPGRPAGPPLTPAELRLLPYLQTHLTIREIARAPVRVAQHGQLPGRLHLPQVRRHVPDRRGPEGDQHRSARRVALRVSRPTGGPSASSVS